MGDIENYKQVKKSMTPTHFTPTFFKFYFQISFILKSPILH